MSDPRPARVRRLSKRVVSAVVALPALVVLLASTRTWLTGRSTEPLLGGGAVSATGSQLAPGVAALAGVALVALLATLTAGPRLRRVAAVVIVLAAVGAVVLAVTPLLQPEAALGRVAAAGLGRSGEVRTTASVSAWAWVGVAAAAVLVLAAPVAVVGATRWSGLSSRFEAPGATPARADAASTSTSPSAPDTTPGSTPAPDHRSVWDEVSQGRDPTVHDEPHPT